MLRLETLFFRLLFMLLSICEEEACSESAIFDHMGCVWGGGRERSGVEETK